MTYLLQSGIFRITLAIVVTALVGGVAALLVERGENAGLESISDAVWWAFVTLTTVGYGGRVPHTLAGRFIGVGLARASGFYFRHWSKRSRKQVLAVEVGTTTRAAPAWCGKSRDYASQAQRSQPLEHVCLNAPGDLHCH